MSHLLRISHQLFVSAVGNGDSRGVDSRVEEAISESSYTSPQAVPLEVLHCTKTIPEAYIRPLRGSVRPGG